MNRLVLGLALLTAACGGHKSFESLCTSQVPPPEACNTACDPASGTGDATCISGFHCAASGKCDALCTQGGSECGDGYSCTTDGFCTSTDDGGGGDPIDANCPAVHFTATKVTPSIQLLIDRSGSMLQDFNGKDPSKAPPPYKFPTEQDALVGTQGVVTQLQDSVYFGASMYPSNMCPGVFQTARAKTNAATIATFLQGHVPDPNGNTPTPAAINSVIDDFMRNPAPPGSPEVIVLATDGLPNDCNGKNGNQAKIDTVNAAKAAFAKDIRLYLLVVGNQIDNTFKQDVANAGQGVASGAKAYTATNPTELSTAFQEIIRGVVSCDLALNGMVDAASAASGSVVLDGMPLTYNTDWMLDAAGTTLRLLGTACEKLKSSADPKVDATFSCGAVIF